MNWIAFISALFLSGLYAYRHRYTSQRRIFKLYAVQFYYLFFLVPLLIVGLFNITYQIILRPYVLNLPIYIPPVILLSFNVFSLVMTIVGASIHSSSTTIYQVLFPDRKSEVFHTNELFHGPLSHNMIQIGCILGALSYVLAETNHPGSQPVNLYFTVSFGIVLAIAQAMATIWGTYIKPSLVVGGIAAAINIILIGFVSGRLAYFPMATVSVSYSLTLPVLLGLYLLIIEAADRNIRTTRSMERYLIKLFPKGHPVKNQ